MPLSPLPFPLRSPPPPARQRRPPAPVSILTLIDQLLQSCHSGGALYNLVTQIKNEYSANEIDKSGAVKKLIATVGKPKLIETINACHAATGASVQLQRAKRPRDDAAAAADPQVQAELKKTEAAIASAHNLLSGGWYLNRASRLRRVTELEARSHCGRAPFFRPRDPRRRAGWTDQEGEEIDLTSRRRR